MAQLQQVSPDAADSGPIFDDEPLQQVSNDDYYNVFAMENVHPEQSKSVHDTYHIEQDAQNVIIDSLDMSYDREEIVQNDDDNDLAKEREIEDFKNKNKSLESSNNFFKEANNRLSETNNLLYADNKKSEAKLARHSSKEYASQMELECAKVRGDLLSYKMDYQKSCTTYTDTINALNQTILEMKDKLSAHQETISILSKKKEAQIKLYKTQEDKELDKVIELENKVKLDWKEKEVLITEGSPITRTERVHETYKNVSQEIRDQLNAEAEAVQIILTRIDNYIYSIVDACSNACEMWKAIERLKQGESINVQDLETNLYWEFGKFTSHDVNVQFLLQLQPEWQWFMTLVKQSQELKIVSYHKLYDILKQHQHEVNEIRAEKIARVPNLLTLVAQQQPVYHPQNHSTHYTQNSSTRSQQATTRNRGKAIVNSPQPIYDQEPSMVAEKDETSKDKEIEKLIALISLSFKKIYKPTNNNLRTSSNTSRTNQDHSLRINRSAGYENQRIGNVVGARETVGSSVVHKSRIQCYNCKEFGHVARECQKPKRAKDAAYHREKMLLCKQEEAGIQLNVEQADWRDDTDDDELEDQELEAHYMHIAQLQEVSPDAADSGPIFDDEPLQKVSNDDHYNVFAIESAHPKQYESVHDTYPIEQDAQIVIIDSLDMNYDREEIDQNDDDNDLAKERELLASLIGKLKCEIDEIKNRNNFLETSNKDLIEK
nr:hypothetical protein [Tanacetum cinerariifolium]